MSKENFSQPIDKGLEGPVEQISPREKFEKELAEMPPLYNEEEYQKLDPDQLLKGYYENDLKKYVDKDGKLVLPGFFTAAHNAPKESNYRREYKKIPGKTVSLVYNFAQEMAYNSIYFENNREIAKQVLLEAFRALNNSKQTDNLTGEKNFWFELETVSGFACVCNVSEQLGGTAIRLGFPELANWFKDGTYCPEGPQYPKPALIRDNNMRVADYDRKYDEKNGYGITYEKYSPEENQENIQSIKRQTMRHIEREINILKSEKRESKSE